jgi:hypothetical protein
MLKKNVDLGPALKVSRWRRLAIGSWGVPEDPSIHGILELNVEKALATIEAHKKKFPQSRVTITHFTAKAIAESMLEVPQLNSVLRFGRFYARKTIDVCFQVAGDSGGKNLSAATLRDVPNLSLSEVADFLNMKAGDVRTGGDPDFRGIKRVGIGVPGFLMSPAIRLLGFFLFTLNLWSPLLGLKRDAFGSVLLTNVGTLGLDVVFPALFYRAARVPAIVALSEVKPMAVVEDGEIKIRKIMRMCTTFDHRFVDGVHAGILARKMRERFQNPEVYFSDEAPKSEASPLNS